MKSPLAIVAIILGACPATVVQATTTYSVGPLKFSFGLDGMETTAKTSSDLRAISDAAISSLEEAIAKYMAWGSAGARLTGVTAKVDKGSCEFKHKQTSRRLDEVGDQSADARRLTTHDYTEGVFTIKFTFEAISTVEDARFLGHAFAARLKKLADAGAPATTAPMKALAAAIASAGGKFAAQSGQTVVYDPAAYSGGSNNQGKLKPVEDTKNGAYTYKVMLGDANKKYYNAVVGGTVTLNGIDFGSDSHNYVGGAGTTSFWTKDHATEWTKEKLLADLTESVTALGNLRPEDISISHGGDSKSGIYKKLEDNVPTDPITGTLRSLGKIFVVIDFEITVVEKKTADLVTNFAAKKAGKKSTWDSLKNTQGSALTAFSKPDSVAYEFTDIVNDAANKVWPADTTTAAPAPSSAIGLGAALSLLVMTVLV